MLLLPIGGYWSIGARVCCTIQFKSHVKGVKVSMWFIQFVLLWYEQLTHLMKKCDVFKRRQKSENHTALNANICLWTCKSQICFLSTWTIGFLFYNNKGLCFHRNFQVLAALDSLMELRLWDFFRDLENDLILSWWEDFWNYGEQTESITEQNSVVFLLITWFLIDFHVK